MPRQNVPYDTEAFEKAVQAVSRGVKVRTAARRYQVPRSTLFDHTKGKLIGKSRGSGRKQALPVQIEDILVQYALFMGDRGFPLTRAVLRVFIIALVKTMNLKTSFNLTKGPTDKWFRAFLRRNPRITQRHPDSLDGNRAEVPHSDVQHYFQLLTNLIEKTGINTPERIFNCDETGFSGKESYKGKVFARRGRQRVYQRIVKFPGHTTVLVAVSGAGEVLPPLTIFEGSCPSAIISDVPGDYTFAATKSGFINSDLFFSWFKGVFVPKVQRLTKPVLLVLDNHVSHLSPQLVDLAIKEKIELLCLPPHTTHFLQPLDVGYFNLLKSAMAQIAVSLGYGGVKCIPKEKFPKILQYGIERVKSDSIKKAFSTTGLYPVKPIIENPLRSTTNTSILANQETQDTDDVCVECGQGKTNQLVKLGIIPKELANVFVEPPKISVGPKRHNSKKLGSRLLTATELNPPDSSEVVPGPSSKSITTEIPPKCPSSSTSKTSKPVKVGKYQKVPTDPSNVCGVCLLGDKCHMKYFTWIGCDNCPQWFHYECLPTSEQTLVDLSLITQDKWLCNQCSFAEE